MFLDIKIDKTNTNKTKWFVDISEYIYMKDKREVHFPTATPFQIVRIDHLFEGKLYQKLELIEEDNEIMKYILEHFESIIGILILKLSRNFL